jgi:hypothetical protein
MIHREIDGREKPIFEDPSSNKIWRGINKFARSAGQAVRNEAEVILRIGESNVLPTLREELGTALIEGVIVVIGDKVRGTKTAGKTFGTQTS